MSSKVVCIGVDGGSYALVEKWAKEGLLPNFARLIEDGAGGELLSVIPPISAPAWSTFMTGKNPGKHGIYGFVRLKEGSYDVEFSCGLHLGAKTLWKLLSERGMRVIVINVPMTYPPEEVNGILISGMDAPGVDSPFTYPVELKEEIDRICGGYSIGRIPIVKSQNRAGLLMSRDGIFELLDKRMKVTFYLAERYEWDFLMVKLNAVDYAQHRFWRYIGTESEVADTIYRAYKAVDDLLPRFEELAEGWLFVMSDHGGGAYSGKIILLNRWLEREGYLRRRRSLVGGGLRRALRRLFIRLPREMRDTLRARLPGLASKSMKLIKFPGIQWQGTKAFLSETRDSIRINSEGAYPQGTVSEGEYHNIREELIEKLGELRDPETGKSVFEKVYRREELYSGDYAGEAPDIVLRPREFSYAVSRRFGRDEGVVCEERERPRGSGTHRLEGMLFIKGRGVRRGVRVNAGIADVAPTILYVMGLGVPGDFDGRVLEGAFDDGFLGENPLRRGSPAGGGRRRQVLEGEDYEELAERLKELGYIE